MSTAQQPSPQEITYNWLRFARDDFTSMQNGVFPVSNSGSQSARANWDVTTPANPFWAYAIGMQFSLTLTLTMPAGSTIVLSPFAPYSGIGVQLTIGGGQAIQPMSLVPFWLDQLTSKREFDDVSYGPAQAANQYSSALTTPATYGVPATNFFLPEWEWDGSDLTESAGVMPPLQITDQAAVKYYPGQTITAGTGVTTLTLTFKFRAWMQLGRKLYGRNLEDLTGCIPLGDPANRPTLYVNINPLIGGFPEQNMFVAPSIGTITCVTHAATPCIANICWISKALDQLPDGVSVGTPKVLSAIEWNTNGGLAIPNAGQFVNLIFDTAMVYNKRFHILVNNQLPISADYLAVWYSENQANARWIFDGTMNNMQEYYRNKVLRPYNRYLPKGVFVADLVGGEFPEFPRETPYRGEIVTSTTLAALTGLKPYPNAQTTIRIPTGTSLTAAYCNVYSLGTVPVAY